MDNKTLAKKLAALAQLDYDAMLAYEEAIKRIPAEDADVRNSLQRFHDDHYRHTSMLSEAVVAAGEIPPKFSRDIKGKLIEGMTALMSAVGTTAALKAMQQNEKLTNKSYAAAVADDDFPSYPASVQTVLQSNFGDEKRHLAYIETALQSQAAATR